MHLTAINITLDSARNFDLTSIQAMSSLYYYAISGTQLGVLGGLTALVNSICSIYLFHREIPRWCSTSTW